MERTKANLSWIFKSRIPTQILWIWNFSDNVFLDVIYPPHPLLPFLLPFFFFLFLLFTIRCIWNFPPLKFKIDRLISPVLTPRYFRFLLLIPRRGKRMNFYLISWKDIIKNLIPIDAHWRNHLLTGSLAKPGPTFLPNFLRVETNHSNLLKPHLEERKKTTRKSQRDSNYQSNLSEPSQTFSNLFKPRLEGRKRREKKGEEAREQP